MIKWFAYIVLLLIFAPGLSSATIKNSRYIPDLYHNSQQALFSVQLTDSLNSKKHQQEEEKKKIKEVLKAKRQAKPEKIGEPDDMADPKIKIRPKRERRPEGLERPPEIPRRNGN